MENTFNCWCDAYKELKNNGFKRIGSSYNRFNNNTEVWFNPENGFVEVKGADKKVHLDFFFADEFFSKLN